MREMFVGLSTRIYPLKLARRARSAPVLLALVLCSTVSTAMLPGQLADIAAFFNDADYENARKTLTEALVTEPDQPSYRVWQLRLTEDPEVAEDLAMRIVRDPSASLELRLQAALDGASVALARQRSETAWRLLQPLLDGSHAALPGELYLLCGQALRLAGDRHRAREMLASVRPDDPAFAAARAALGRIALEMGDHELALLYFESAERRLDPGTYLELKAGAWQALRMLGRDLEARDLAVRLAAEHPFSLAALEVREIQRREAQEIADAEETVPAEPPTPAPKPLDAGRYTIQLAAFADRTLGLQYVARWRAEITGLHIVRAQDSLGQPLHRVQVGSFTSRSQAETELNRLKRLHDLDGFVTESVE